MNTRNENLANKLAGGKDNIITEDYLFKKVQLRKCLNSPWETRYLIGINNKEDYVDYYGGDKASIGFCNVSYYMFGRCIKTIL